MFYNCNRPASTLSGVLRATGCMERGRPSVGLELGAGNLSSGVGGGPATRLVSGCVSSISVDLGAYSSRGCSRIYHPIFSRTCRSVLGFTRSTGGCFRRARFSVMSAVPRRSVGTYRGVTSSEKVCLGVEGCSSWSLVLVFRFVLCFEDGTSLLL